MRNSFVTKKGKTLPPRVANSRYAVNGGDGFAVRLLNELFTELTETDPLLQSLLVRKGIAAPLALTDTPKLASILSLQCSTQDAGASSLSQKASWYQLGSLLKKYTPEKPSSKLHSAAVETFLSVEEDMLAYNTRTWTHWFREAETISMLFALRRTIEEILGPEPDLEEVLLKARHGPGSSIGNTYKRRFSYYKYRNWPYTVTRGAKEHAIRLIESDQRWLGSLDEDYRERYSIPPDASLWRRTYWDSVLTIVPGNRITTVPKDVTTNRCIAVEPTMNLALQLGVDSVIRSAMRRFGYDISDQSLNQALARLGSMISGDRSYVTLDLASASDSVSLRLCHLVLPTSWYRLLIQLRSARGSVNGSSIAYRKISSMGNGTTFALESLIFCAILEVAATYTGVALFPGDSSVIGDDLAYPPAIDPRVRQLLKLAGFKVNVRKTFHEGYVRESCGQDFWLGHNIRPVFLKQPLKTVCDAFGLYNRMKRWADYNGCSIPRTLQAIWDLAPRYFSRCQGPYTPDVARGWVETSKSLPHPQHGYRWRCLIEYRRPRLPKDIRFGKLMHSLHETPTRVFWETTESGSRFDLSDKILVRPDHQTDIRWLAMHDEVIWDVSKRYTARTIRLTSEDARKRRLTRQIAYSRGSARIWAMGT